MPREAMALPFRRAQLHQVTSHCLPTVHCHLFGPSHTFIRKQNQKSTLRLTDRRPAVCPTLFQIYCDPAAVLIMQKPTNRIGPS